MPQQPNRSADHKSLLSQFLFLISLFIFSTKLATMLRMVLVAPTPMPRLPGLARADAVPPTTQSRVISRVLAMLFHSADRPDHVLAFGFGRRKDSSSGVGRRRKKKDPKGTNKPRIKPPPQKKQKRKGNNV
jgi:hypothetical protein